MQNVPFRGRRVYLFGMNEPAHDNELLREYVHAHSEPAFTELVDRYANLVFSVAVRRLHDFNLAQDVAQQVFTDMATKARSLIGHRVLAGWLYTATVFTSAKLLREQDRREAREREAVAMNELHSDASPDWARLGPELDAAVAGLKPVDRDAVLLLSFYRGRTTASGSNSVGCFRFAVFRRLMDQFISPKTAPCSSCNTQAPSSAVIWLVSRWRSRRSMAFTNGSLPTATASVHLACLSRQSLRIRS